MTAHPPTEHHAPITLVTAYFALDDKSAQRPDGRTSRDYHQWMANFLPVINWPLAVFCDEQSVGIIKRLRGSKPAVYHITRFEEFSVYRHRHMLRAHIAQRWPGFPADMSLIYHEKANFVRRAMDENPYRSEMFFWCDICRFRQPKGRSVFQPSDRIEWPNLRICRTAFGNQVAFFTAAFDVHDRARPWILETIWGGRAKPMRRFCDDYYRYLNSRMSANPAASGRAVPKGMGYHTAEMIFNSMSESADFNMRVFTTNDILWLRALERLTACTVGRVRGPAAPPPPHAESRNCSCKIHGALLRVHVLLPERRAFSMGVSRSGSLPVGCDVGRDPLGGKNHPPTSRFVATQRTDDHRAVPSPLI